MMVPNLMKLFLVLAVIQGGGGLGKAKAESEKMDPHEYYLSHRSCLAFMIGLDWIQDAMNKVIEQSVRHFTGNYLQGRKAQMTPFEEKLKSLSWAATLLPPKDESPLLFYTNESIAVSREVAVKARLKEVSLSFRAKITLHLIYSEGEKSLVPQLSSKITGFACEPSPIFE